MSQLSVNPSICGVGIGCGGPSPLKVGVKGHVIGVNLRTHGNQITISGNAACALLPAGSPLNKLSISLPGRAPIVAEASCESASAVANSIVAAINSSGTARAQMTQGKNGSFTISVFAPFVANG